MNSKAICFNCGQLYCHHWSSSVGHKFCYSGLRSHEFTDQPTDKQIIKYLNDHEPAILESVISSLLRRNGHEV